MSATPDASNGDFNSAPAIGVKQAVRSALEFLADLYEDEQIWNVQLEEVELNDDGARWLITIGFDRMNIIDEISPLIAPPAPRVRRDYKVIGVDADSGEAVSMKIRKI